MTEWVPPESSDLRPRWATATTALDEFVHGHSYLDMVTELIQNEFDAGGSRIFIDFSANHLQVTGSGNTIDSNGWKRLSVMFGTGRAAAEDGTTSDIPPKDDLIGAKNFGLNTLFLVGDRIDVSSGGRYSFKDRLLGAPASPEADPQTKDLIGVMIHVGYREVQDGDYVPFTAERELQVIDSLINHFEYCAVKLAQPEPKAGLKRIEVKSERLDRRIVWTQRASIKTLRGKKKAIERTIHVQDGTPTALPNPKILLKEIEFQDSVSIPDNIHVPASFRDGEVPKYYRPRRGKVRIGISLRLKQGRLDWEHRGLFYYPLGLRSSRSGTAVSVNAPFHLDNDRSSFSENTGWNDWLLEQAADITIDCLVDDWREGFGPRSFLALREAATPSSDAYLRRIFELLGQRPCWPTQSRTRNALPVLCPARSIVIPKQREFFGFLSPDRYLDASMDSGIYGESIKKLALDSGAKHFGINALIRLRCKDSTDRVLETELLDGEADYRYTDLDQAFKDEDRQIKFARALETARTDLTQAHKNDLKNASTTLSAKNELKPAKDLFAVNPVIGQGCPVPLMDRLHPSLWDFLIFRDKRHGVCQLFEENGWALTVGDDIKSGEATSQQREGLYRYIISVDGEGKLNRTTTKTLRDLAVLKDHRDKWAVPSQIMPRQTSGARELEPVLSFPNRAYAANAELRSRFGFRKNFEGADLVRMAEHVGSNPELADAFEASLQRHEGALKQQDWKQLSEISFLKWSAEQPDDLEAPKNLYLRKLDTEAALGDRAKFPSGSRVALYRKLGCMELPKASSIILHISDLRGKGDELPNVDRVYPALVDALKAEGLAVNSYDGQPIVWLGGAYVSPRRILTGNRSPKLLQSGVPHIRGPKRFVDAVSELGAESRASDRHWAMGFEWVGRTYANGTGPIDRERSDMLRDAYYQRRTVGLPDGLAGDVKCLLGRDGRLYSRGDVAAGRFVFNDYPELADAAEAQSVAIGFPDESERSQTFFGILGLVQLTEKMNQPNVVLGNTVDPRSPFDPVKTLEKLHAKDLASALHAIGMHYSLSNTAFKPPNGAAIGKALEEIQAITVVESLELVYQLEGVPVKVDAEVWLGANQLFLTAFKMSELNQLLAIGLARVLSTSASDHGALWNTINGLLACRKSEGMKAYLSRSHIPWVPGSSDVRDESEDDDLDDWPSPDDEDTKVLLINEIVDNAKRVKERADGSGDSAPSAPTGSGQKGQGPRPGGPATSPQTLPPVGQVRFQNVPVSGSWSSPERNNSSGAGGSNGGGGWSPRTTAEKERDEEIGRRGEQLTFENERERVTEEGGDATRVVWTSQHDPGANHDIKSVGADGKDIWIEVKSTSGKDGGFSWSIAEFEKAAMEGDRYILRRVYMAGSDDAKWKDFPNPVAMWKNKKLAMEVKDFWAEVEPLDA